MLSWKKERKVGEKKVSCARSIVNFDISYLPVITLHLKERFILATSFFCYVYDAPLWTNRNIKINCTNEMICLMAEC